jgi:hypothetical protein
MEQSTHRGPSPSKASRTPQQAMEIARRNPGPHNKVLYSEGHEKYGARVKANNIRTGKSGPWKQYLGEVRSSALKQPDGTYNVYIYIDPTAVADVA